MANVQLFDGQDDFSGGMKPIRFMSTGQEKTAVVLRNIEYFGDGFFAWRRGREKVTMSPYYEDSKPQAITGLYGYKYTPSLSKKLLICAGTKIFSYDYINKATTEIATGMTADVPWNFAEFMDSVVLCQKGALPLKYDGTTVSAITAPPGNLEFTEEYQNYLFGATGEDQFLYFSDLYNIDSWNDSFRISASRYDPVKAAKKFLGALWVFSERELHVIEGGSRSYFQKYNIVKGIGTVGYQTVHVVKDKMIWLDQDGFWMTDGGVPERIGFPVAQITAKIDQNRIGRSWAVVRRDPVSGYINYRCFVPVAESGAGTYNNLCFVYNWDNDAWHIDDFVPGEIAATAEDEYGNQDLYASGEDGLIYKLYSSNSDDGQVIPGEFISRPYDCGKPELDKHFTKIYLWYRAATQTTIKVQFSVDFGKKYAPSSGYKTVTLDGSGELPNIYELMALADRTHWLRDVRAKCISIPVELDGKKLQVRIGNSEIGTGVQFFRILVEANAGGLTP